MTKQMEKAWTYKGRLNRRPYVFRSLAVSILLFLLGKAFLIHLTLPLALLMLAVTIGAIIFAIFQWIQRLHDLDKSGWYLLFILVPVVSLVFGLYLIFAKGTEGPNRFGEDPLPNGAGPSVASE